MNYDFSYSAHPSRVIFGAGSLSQLPKEVEALGCQRALVLCTPQRTSQAEVVAGLLGQRCAGIYSGAQMHVPVERAREARVLATKLEADCAVAVGGGSTVGLGKAIALESAIPIVAIPTTYAGSEMTPIYGLTEAGRKRTGKDPKVLPKTVVYDPELSRGLPVKLSVVSGINALAHAAEGLYARDTNPVMSLIAEEGIRALAQGLPKVVAEPASLEARSACLYGAWLCGTVLGHVGMALHHKLCHTLGGSFNLSHAETHTVVLPYALAYNRAAVPAAIDRIGRALAAESAPGALQQLARELGAPTSLKELGLLESDLPRVCQLALEPPHWNPRPVEAEPLQALLSRAFSGAAADEI